MVQVIIDYRVKADVSLEDFKGTVSAFVAKLGQEDPGATYTSYQHEDNDRAFSHVGRFPDADRLKEVQAQEFFTEFAAFLKGNCEEGPDVTRLSQVASTK